jgi:hypothetical protein
MIQWRGQTTSATHIESWLLLPPRSLKTRSHTTTDMLNWSTINPNPVRTYVRAFPWPYIMPLCTSMHARPRTTLMRTGRARSLALVFASQHATMAMCTSSSYQRGNSGRRLLSSELDRACLAELADISVLPVSSYMHGSSIWRSRRADRRCAYRMCFLLMCPNQAMCERSD